jgi:hypothetical protein
VFATKRRRLTRLLEKFPEVSKVTNKCLTHR